MKYYEVYTDGSFLSGDNMVHGSVVFVNPDTKKPSSLIHVQSTVPELVSMWSVGGELLAAWSAILAVVNSVKKFNEESGLDTYKLTITHDNEGVAAWITRGWKTKKKGTRWYKETIKEMLSSVPNLQLEFKWVPGHSGNELNELADRVASYDPANRHPNASVCDMDEVLKDYF